nr:PAS domain-containing protein [Oceanococcus sp. HetDA_MAG_MS8]
MTTPSHSLEARPHQDAPSAWSLQLPEGIDNLEQEFLVLMQNNSGVLECMHHGAVDGLWYHDLERPERTWLSPAFWQLLGLDPAAQDASTQAWHAVIHPDDLDLARKGLQHDLQAPNHRFDEVLRHVHLQGHTLWLRCRGAVVHDSQGKPRRMLGAHVDLSTVLRQQQALQRKNDELVARNESLSQFVYSAAHDIKAPLNSIKGLTHLLQQDLDAGDLQQSRESLLHLTQAAERLSNLVGDLLDMGQSGNLEPQWSSVDLNELLSDIVYDLCSTLSQPGRATIEVRRMPVLLSDRTLLRQIFQNLLSNALKYQRPQARPRVTVSCELIPEGFRFAVKDNGIGIEQDQLEAIFEPFHRLNNHEEYEGTGLGLANCSLAAKALGGSIRAVSVPQQGTTFLLSLPANPPDH